MRRREFISLLGVAAGTWPLELNAQQSDRIRRIGVLMAATMDDPEYQARIAAFQQGLQQMGWSNGRNVSIDTRWATTNPYDIRKHAAELAALTPDVIVAGTGTATVAPLLQATRSVDRFRVGHRPGRRWLHRQPGAAGWQRDRVHGFRIRHERKMAGAAEATGTHPDAGSGASGSHHRIRNRAVRGRSSRGHPRWAWI